MSDPDERETAIRELEAEFGRLFQQVRRVISASAERLSPGMLPGTYKVFTTIVREGSVTLSSLAETLVADKGQTSRTVRELESLGFIERTPDPEDGRSSRIAPTAWGLERLAEAREPHKDGLLQSLAEWPVDDLRTLARLLHRLREDTER